MYKYMYIDINICTDSFSQHLALFKNNNLILYNGI